MYCLKTAGKQKKKQRLMPTLRKHPGKEFTARIAEEKCCNQELHTPSPRPDQNLYLTRVLDNWRGQRFYILVPDPG